MATSTEDTIRAALVTAVEAIATTELGFDDANGNINNYLLGEEIPERLDEYLMSNVSSKKRVRAWGIQVYGNEIFDRAASQEIGTRLYEIIVEGYYGVHGTTPINTIITHARKVREAIYGLTLHLGRRVDKVSDFSELQINRQKVADVTEEVMIGRMVIAAERYNPDY
jgi:hypothetical protein